MSEIFYAGMIPFYLDTCVCVPDVMGSALWLSTYEGPMTYDSGGFYWNDLGGLGPQSMYWPESSAGFQSIEVTVSNFGPLEDGGDVLALYCRSTDIADESAGLQFWVRKYEESVGPTGPYWDWFVQADGDILTEAGSVTPWPFSDPTTFLLESDTNGDFRVYVDGSLLTSGVDPTQSAGTTQIGWYVDRYAAGDETTSVHVSDICVKICGSNCYLWSETFDGSLSGWEENDGLRTVVVSSPAPQPITTFSGDGITDCATGASPAIGMGSAVRSNPTPARYGQFIEIVVADFFQLPGDAADFRSEIQVFNFGNDPSSGNPGGNFGYVRWESDIEEFTLAAWSQNSGGPFAGDDPGAIVLSPWPSGTPGGSAGDLTLRLESYNTGTTILHAQNQFIGFTDTGGGVPGPGFHQGITMWWDVHFGACEDATSPRIVSAVGGELCAPEPE